MGPSENGSAADHLVSGNGNMVQIESTIYIDLRQCLQNNAGASSPLGASQST